jgi:hypothetical protein
MTWGMGRDSYVGRSIRCQRGVERLLMVAVLAGASPGCASSPPPPPAPIDPVGSPALRDWWVPADIQKVAPTDVVFAHRAARVPSPPKLWIPPAVRLSPKEPREGSAVAVHLLPLAAAQQPVEAEVELAGRPLTLVRTREGWFGVGALPVGSSGRHLLAARFRAADGTWSEVYEPVVVAGRFYPATELRVAGRFMNPPADELARIAEERKRIRGMLETPTPEWLAHDGFALPRQDRTTSPFGQRRVFNGELRSRHWGLDIDGEEGEWIRAAGAGRVSLSGEFYYQGNAVYLDHGLGVHTGYFHMSGIAVQDGEWVTRGQVIGHVGSTGRVTGPHLHWSLYVGGVSLDPASLLEIDVSGHHSLPGAERVNAARASVDAEKASSGGAGVEDASTGNQESGGSR